MSPRLVDATSVLYSEQQNPLSFFAKQKWRQRITSLAEIRNLIHMRDRGLPGGVCAPGQWFGATATTVERCAPERRCACSPCAGRTVRPGAVLELPAGEALVWAVLPAVGHRRGLLTSAWVDLQPAKTWEKSEIPISTTGKGWSATVASTVNSGHIRIHLLSRGGPHSLLCRGGSWNLCWAFSSQRCPGEAEPADRGHSLAGTGQLSLQLAPAVPLNHTCGSEGESSARC